VIPVKKSTDRAKIEVLTLAEFIHLIKLTSI